jgi:hypothetical protein
MFLRAMLRDDWGRSIAWWVLMACRTIMTTACFHMEKFLIVRMRERDLRRDVSS